METANIQVSGLVWDALSEAKIAVHGLSIQDVEAVRHNAPKFFTNLPGRSADYVMLGPDEDGRFVFAAIVSTHDPERWYVVTAFRLERRRALRIYERS